MTAERIDIGEALATEWLPEVHTAIFASATMTVSKSFEHFNHAVGLDRIGASTSSSLHLDSSYDFDSNMAVVVAGDIPDPRDRESYLTALERVLVDAHLAMGGSVLTLFTNRRDMEDLYARVEPKMARAGLELNCQQRNSSPRRLRDRFINEPTSSLFALKAFWEGFDASGETLRCVIIPKLPFSSPTDPLSCERNLREDRAWARYSLPEAVLEVKQAAGRLIRSSTDCGVLILADPRLVTKGYGKKFLTSLPTSPISASNRRRSVTICNCGAHATSGGAKADRRGFLPFRTDALTRRGHPRCGWLRPLRLSGSVANVRSRNARLPLPCLPRCAR